MILIADCGGTKSDWCLVNRGTVTYRFIGAGINAAVINDVDALAGIFESVKTQLSHHDTISNIFYYGAGATGTSALLITELLKNVFPFTAVEVSTDMLGAARSLCGNRPGIAAILGTGSNSCYYDGRIITANTPPLGYILGDEGSGASMGKALINGIFKQLFSRGIIEAFNSHYNLYLDEIITKVYRGPNANAYLASFAIFISKHRKKPEIKGLIENCFSQFFERNIMQYPEHGEVPMHAVGSVAWHFKEELYHVAELRGIHLATVQQSPMPGLIKFHSR